MTEQTLNIPEAAIRLIKEFEGFRPKPYLCPAGKPTIGYGTTVLNGKDVTLKTPAITEEQATEALVSFLHDIAGEIDSTLLKELNDNQFAAILSFCYNFGVPSFKGSTLYRKLKRKEYASAADEFKRWSLSNGKPLSGLIRRRAAEEKLFKTPV